MILHGTGVITDVENIGPFVEREIAVTEELRNEGLIVDVFRRSHEPGVFLILEAESVADAEHQLARLPFVAEGLIKIELVEIYRI
jgi:hypothetical protein